MKIENKKHTLSYLEDKISQRINDEHEDILRSDLDDEEIEVATSSYKVEHKKLETKYSLLLKALHEEKSAKLLEIDPADTEAINKHIFIACSCQNFNR